ncbi:MAG: ABC transporter permease [Chloroflexota bacterium]|nr:ABC transporter permease [Chloroflexota bacterium]
MENSVKQNPSLKDRMQSFIKNGNGNIVRLLTAVIIIFFLLSVTRYDTFLTVRNMQSMAFQASEIGILTIAIMLTMISGGIDLAIVSTANLSGIIAGLILTSMVPLGSPPVTVALGMVIAILAALVVGVVCGAFSGYLIAFWNMPAILATLGTSLLYKGLGTAITGGSTIFGIEESQFIGNGLVLGIPFPLILLLVVAIIIGIITRRTRFGLNLYMLGTNPTASHFSGINNRQILVFTYMISGILSAIAGIVILGRTNAMNVDFGASYVLLAILIAVLGDVDPAGGSGSVIGVILALVALQFLSTGFNMLLFRSSGANFFKEFAWGMLLIIVLIINHLSAKRRANKTIPEQE